MSHNPLIPPQYPEHSMNNLRDGEPCNHPGCLHHLSHPCEGWGRIAGRSTIFYGGRNFGKSLRMETLKEYIKSIGGIIYENNDKER